MPDIFLSYSREDQVTARRFAEGFEREGLSVWWDATLNPGEAYDKVTEKALEEAKAVVVLWSKKSVDSRWVRSEATQASSSGTLVPVMIEPCKRPIMFELTHTADLSQWKGDAGDPFWQSYVAAVRRFVRKEGAAGFAAPVASQPSHHPWASVKVLGILAALMVAGGLLWGYTRYQGAQPAAPAAAVATSSPAAAASRTAVAVMPFANLTGDASKDYLGDGMAEQLMNALTMVPGLTVPSRTSSFAYKGRNVDLKQIAKDLNVGTVLEGSVQSAGTTIRITAQLIDAQSDRQLWSKNYDRKFEDLFKLQDDLAREIVAAFKSTVHADLPDFESQAPPTKNLEAYSLYLQGTASQGRISDDSDRKAIELLEKAVTLDPGFARAYLALAESRGRLSYPFGDVERDARRAMALDPSLTDVVKLRLFVTAEVRRGNYIAAEEMFRSLAPNAADPGYYVGHALTVLWPTGQLQKNLEANENAYRLAPGAGGLAWQVGMANSALGRDAQAVKLADAAVTLGIDPAGRRVKQIYAAAAGRAGRYSEAAEDVIAWLPDNVKAAGGANVVKLVYAAQGDPARRPAAIAALQGLLPKIKPEDWQVKVAAMGWSAQLGALDTTYQLADQLREQFADRNPLSAWSWLWSPELREFRKDPRFQAFATRLGLMAFWQKYGPPDGCDLKDRRLICH